ncbi:MAG: hypothetical protein SO401_07290 [Blautia sp.]|nr:hypothetical protein [Clostridia bacterium]MDY4693349.1 hypothetical protein [Blautia sp.]MDY5554881.1 hypothetical protein [Blautia sp.]
MTEQELKQKYNMFTDAWKLYRRWAVMEFPLTDAQWAQIVEESHKIRDRYSGKMIEYLMIAATQGLDELERQARE